MKISVIIAVYNGEEYITQSIDSVLNQDFEDFEVIVVDDGSIDNTEAICRRYGDRIKYLQKENGGCGSAFNAGYEVASGEFIAIQSHDDIWLPNKLSLQWKAVKNYGADFVFTDACYFHGNIPKNEEIESDTSPKKTKLRNSDDMLRALLLGNLVVGVTPIFRSEIFKKVGGFDESLTNAEDYDLWLKFAAIGCKFHYIDKVCAMIRKHPGNKSKNYERMHRSRMMIVKQIFEMDYFPADHKYLKPAAIARVYRDFMNQLWRADEYVRYIEAFTKMKSTHPRSVRLSDYRKVIKARLLCLFSSKS